MGCYGSVNGNRLGAVNAAPRGEGGAGGELYDLLGRFGGSFSGQPGFATRAVFGGFLATAEIGKYVFFKGFGGLGR